MNIRAVILAAAVGGSALALAACNNGGSTFTGPTPGPTCGPAVASQLIFPNPSGTPAPDTIPEVVIAVSSPLPNNEFNLALTNTNTNGVAFTSNFLGQIQASQLPAGSAPVTISNPTYEAVNLIASLPAATTISVAINDTFSNCTPQNVTGGSFKTQ